MTTNFENNLERKHIVKQCKMQSHRYGTKGRVWVWSIIVPRRGLTYKKDGDHRSRDE